MYLEALDEIVTSDTQGMIFAAKVLDNPTVVDNIDGMYVIIYDTATVSMKYDKLNRVINIMAEKGWRCVNITATNSPVVWPSTIALMYALMEKLQTSSSE
jgi:hypothetical protein